MNQNPLVSIITVSYNSEKFIRKTFESVANQSYENFEYFLIDGGSEDNTISIAKEFQKKMKQSFYVLSEKDDGIYDAMNKGIASSKGELICLINSDDFYELNAIELYVKRYLESNTADDIIIIGNANMVDIEGKKRFTRLNTQKILDDGIEFTMPLTHPAYCVHRNVYKNIGSYNSNIKIIADYDFTYKAYKKSDIKFSFINNITVNMREGGISDDFKFWAIWDRTISRYKVRKNYQNPIQNIYLCFRFFSEEIIRQFLKKHFSKSKLLKTNRKK